LFDLPIAIGLLASIGRLKSESFQDYLIVGELGLGGEIRYVSGTLPLAMLAKSSKKKGIIVPQGNAKEAALVPDIEVIAASTLTELVQHFNGSLSLSYSQPKSDCSQNEQVEPSPLVDFSEIHGQAQGKRAIEIAAAGN